MGVAKTLSSNLFSCVIVGIPLAIALLFIGSAQARNDGFKDCIHPEHGHERKRAASEGSFERFFRVSNVSGEASNECS
jgi:hypothetical protein